MLSAQCMADDEIRPLIQDKIKEVQTKGAKLNDFSIEPGLGQEQTYYQLKHTIASKGTHIERMRDRDTDLWKTLSMWIDKIEKQGDETAQMEWIRESEFVLISNKTTETNTFFQLAEAYKNEGRWEELKNYIAEQATKDSSGSLESKKNIRAYIRHVNDFYLLSEFLKRVKAEPQSFIMMNEEAYDAWAQFLRA